jgi:hypothetical protein
MEPDGHRFRVATGQGAEPGERLCGPSLVEASNRIRDEGLRVRGSDAGCGRELPLRRDRALEPLEGDTIEQLGPGIAAARVSGQRGELLGR